MKSIIRLSAAVLVTTIILSGCTKVATVYDNPLTGSWVLTDAAEKDAHGWYTIRTGLETGVFRFFNDGTVRYSDRNVNMQGTWYVQTVSSGYYDQYGNYYTNPHQSLEMHLSDYYSHSTMDLFFDDIDMRGNYFITTNYSGGLIEKYTFSRY